jgi:hypothetical protein
MPVADRAHVGSSSLFSFYCVVSMSLLSVIGSEHSDDRGWGKVQLWALSRRQNSILLVRRREALAFGAARVRRQAMW